jgi:hypothetical protein
MRHLTRVEFADRRKQYEYPIELRDDSSSSVSLRRGSQDVWEEFSVIGEEDTENLPPFWCSSVASLIRLLAFCPIESKVYITFLHTG